MFFVNFSANSDDSSVVKNRLPSSIVVKLIRIIPVLEEDSPISLRIEVFGCGEGETTPVTSTEEMETTTVSGSTIASTSAPGMRHGAKDKATHLQVGIILNPLPSKYSLNTLSGVTSERCPSPRLCARAHTSKISAMASRWQRVEDLIG